MADFSVALTSDLEQARASLPADFNIPRFVQNSIALLNGNDTLKKFVAEHPQNGASQVKAGLLRAAYVGLDALNAECYLVPFGSTLNFMPSYKGDVKLAKKYSTRPIKDIYAKLVREGDLYEEYIDGTEQKINFKPIPFSKNDYIGVFAVCLFEDGGLLVESMSKEEVEEVRSTSKAQNSAPWKKFWGEMAKKTALHRLCKHISIDFDAKQKEAFEAGMEIETDEKELVAREIQENENSVIFEEVEN